MKRWIYLALKKEKKKLVRDTAVGYDDFLTQSPL